MTLKKYSKLDNLDYYHSFSKQNILEYLFKTEQYYIKKYLKYLRKEEYYKFIKPNKILRFWYFRKKNILGAKLGFFIPAGCFDLGLKISHYGSVIVNPNSKIGKNCVIHGNCCIGNKGGENQDSPIIGDNVDIGQNAQILGGVTIANGVKIGAGAIVTKSVLEENVIVTGIPAKIIKKC